ncbi:4101_t:CDS:1, partial [Acaulospora morrowiae]
IQSLRDSDFATYIMIVGCTAYLSVDGGICFVFGCNISAILTVIVNEDVQPTNNIKLVSPISQLKNQFYYYDP